jgi:O-antigen/teichoic acid export membrane protein
VTVSLIKNFASLTGAEAFSKLITFVAFAYLARICGPSGFGTIEWSAAILMCASLIVDQGFSAYGAREIAKEPARTPDLIAEIVTARFLLAFIGYAAIVIFALIFVHKQLVINLLLVYGLSLWALPLLFQWVFQGHDRMKLVALTQIVRQTVFVAVVITFVRKSDDLLFVGIAEVVGVAFAAMLSVWMYKRYFGGRLNLRPILSAKLFREGVPIGVSQMFWVIRMFGATLILGLVATAEDTGYFAGAMRILIALHTFVWLYYFNLLPSMSRAWIIGQEEFSELIRNSMRMVMLASAGIGVVWVFIAPLIMTSVYGQSFSNGGRALQWMAGVWVAAALSGHYRFGLIAAGQQKKEMTTSALGAVAALVFIPLGYLKSGPGGAAAALCFTELTVLLTTWLIARRKLFGSHSNIPQTEPGCLESIRGTSR